MCLTSVALAVLASGCDGPSSPLELSEWSLNLERTLGGPGEAGGAATPGVLGSPVAVAAVAGLEVVLDRQADRLVAFDRSGDVAASAGRAGDGPGEFRLARHVVRRGDDAVSVLDYQSGRITVFSVPSLEVEEVNSSVQGLGFHHVWVEDTVWVVRPNAVGEGVPLAVGYDASTGAVLEAGPTPHPEDLEFGGAYGVVAAGDELLVSTRRPGVWWARSGGTWRRVGAPLFPDATPERRTEVRPGMWELVPSSARASEIAVLQDSLVLQRYVLRDDEPGTAEPGRRTFLGVFELDGGFLGAIPIENTEAGCLNAYGERVYLCAFEPFPQVRVYRLERSGT